jgi:hypothetical protein
MSVKTEIAELMNKDGQMYDWASKVEYKRNLSSDEKEISTIVDAWAKEIGKKGLDRDNEIASFILKTIQPEVYDKPDALLSTMFNRGSIGEFDDEVIDVAPKNTLKAYDAAKGGNVYKSYIDVQALKPTWKHKQIECEISYADLRRNGYKSIAQLTTFAQESLKNAMISDVFNILDTAVAGSDQVFAITGSSVDKTSMDKLALYVIDHADNGDTPFSFSLNKYAQQIANIAGYTSFMSDSMKDDYNRYGLVKEYGGMLISGISGAKKASDGSLLVPDKRIFGVAGKIGNLDMRGDLRIYQTADNNKEKFNLKITGYEYGTVITYSDKVAKITFTA